MGIGKRPDLMGAATSKTTPGPDKYRPDKYNLSQKYSFGTG